MAPRNPDIEPTSEPASTPVSTPPGPIQLEIRVNGKIACLQRVYQYSIDQDASQIAVYGSLTPSGRKETLNVQPE